MAQLLLLFAIMATGKRKRSRRWWIMLVGGVIVFLAGALLFLGNFYVEPVLRKRLHTIIVEGSDSLYTYTLGDLRVNFLGGNVSVIDLHVAVDSTKYNRMLQRREIPSMIMELDINSAHIRGIGLFALLLSKKININEISSKDANIRINRYLNREDTAATTGETPPLWKAIQPNIAAIAIKRIKLDGIRLLYKNQEGAEGKLQFDRCDALFENIRVDSAAIQDTSRIGYVENFSFRLNDLKFRTSDSAYKLKAEWITYNSAGRLLQVDSFKLQPTLKDNERDDTLRKSWYTVTFDRVSFAGLRLDRYLRLNRAEADSVVLENPSLAVYQDKLGLKSYASKIGKYPHQLLVGADVLIDIKKIIARNMQVAVTERHETTREVGTIQLSDIDLTVNNIVNDPVRIRQNSVATAEARGKIIGSPIEASFRFYLDSADGRFDVTGQIAQMNASQINPISTRLANIEVPSVNISSLRFFVRGEDYEATANVEMVYHNLSLIFRRWDEETGANSRRGFLTKIVNRYAINPFNAGERRAVGVRAPRLTTQSFFGIIWKSVFAGMQSIMLKTG